MTEDRIRRLEEENQQRAVDHARLSASVEHLSASVQQLSATVLEFRDTMNKGRGALWVIIGASTFVGGAMQAALNKLISD